MFTEQEQQLLDIAKATAKSKAEQYTQQQRGKEAPRRASFVLAEVATAVGEAITDALTDDPPVVVGTGFLSRNLTHKYRRAIALEALKDANYPGIDSCAEEQ